MVKSMDTIVNLCKARGYIYPGSEIYGGLSKYLGLWTFRSRTKKQCKKIMEKEIHSRK